MTYILDGLMKFINKNIKATFADDGKDVFDTKNFGEAIRRCKPEALDKDDLKKMAHEINQDAEGAQGTIAKAIVQTEDPSKYLDFFCHFKVLFKFVQIGLSCKRQVQLQKKLDQVELEIQELKSKVKDEEKVLEELSFHENMRREA